MRITPWLCAAIGLTDAAALVAREPDTAVSVENSPPKKPWKPKTHNPEFFSIRVDQKCKPGQLPADCPFQGYGLRLEDGIVIATPYNKWWDPKLPIFLVDSDTQCYTVSKKPLQLFVNTVNGALRYAPVGWLPENSVAFSFYKTGNNPLGMIDPSPSYFAWPSTEGRTSSFFAGTWWLCPLTGTGQYQVFISDFNFGDKSKQGGVTKDQCTRMSLAAVNANPWS
ncbi:hypothetical protein IQ06DRAFT_357905 [Phaeosphaeriaceae sp. SRC1lsM3a]|nr:hypothetical protein IQ06DRAFT_357905 [Stagonospora sp. SRC1lsM3a]